MNSEEFNRDFERRQREEMIRRRDVQVTDFLKTLGFQQFTSDGDCFLDKDGRKYSDHCLLHPFTTLEEGVQRRYDTLLRDIRPEKDLFSLIYLPSDSVVLRRSSIDIPARICFTNNRTPSPQEYNGFFLFEGVSWYISAMDGSFNQAMYPVLMLKSDIKPEA